MHETPAGKIKLSCQQLFLSLPPSLAIVKSIFHIFPDILGAHAWAHLPQNNKKALPWATGPHSQTKLVWAGCCSVCVNPIPKEGKKEGEGRRGGGRSLRHIVHIWYSISLRGEQLGFLRRDACERNMLFQYLPGGEGLKNKMNLHFIALHLVFKCRREAVLKPVQPLSPRK